MKHPTGLPNLKRITFTVAARTRPNGGSIALYEFANAMRRRGHSVNVMHGEIPSAKLRFQWGGETLEFESFDNCLSRVTAETILSGHTYPLVPFVRDVSVVMDVGANVGGAAVFFSLAYPDATIFAFEPGSWPYRLLRANPADSELDRRPIKLQL